MGRGRSLLTRIGLGLVAQPFLQRHDQCFGVVI